MLSTEQLSNDMSRHICIELQTVTSKTAIAEQIAVKKDQSQSEHTCRVILVQIAPSNSQKARGTFLFT